MGSNYLWRIVHSFGVLAFSVVSASLCADKQVILDGQVSSCSNASDTLSEKGLAGACVSLFCANCAYANACDASCGFCPSALESPELPSEMSNWSSNNACSDANVLLNGIHVDCATAALATSANGLEAACPAFFCASCKHAHACDESCGFCEVSVQSDTSLGDDEREVVHIVINTNTDAGLSGNKKASKPVDALDPPCTSNSSSPELATVDYESLPLDWWPCSTGELLDCQGRCRSPSACRLGPLAYITCRHWISDGTCDDGCYDVGNHDHQRPEFDNSLSASVFEGTAAEEQTTVSSNESIARCGRRSDEGESMAWNCPLYGCDGGDCEVCQPNPPGVPQHAMAPRHLLISSVASAGLASFGSGLEASGADLSWLWPGLDQHQPSKSGDDREENDEDVNSGALTYRAQCRNMPLHVAGGATLTCTEAIAQGLATCEHSFCDGCGVLAGACDEACNYCQRGIDPFQTTWPGRSKPWLSSDAIHPLAWLGDFTSSGSPDVAEGNERQQPMTITPAAASADAMRIHSKTKAELTAAIRKAQSELERKVKDSKVKNHDVLGSEDKSSESTRDEGHQQHSRNISLSNTSDNITAALHSTAAPRQPVSWVIVLTVCLSPLPGMTHTVRSLPQLRLRDYARALRRWAGDPSLPITNGMAGPSAAYERKLNVSEPSIPWPLVVVESSGANLTALRWAVAEGYAAVRAYHDDSVSDVDNGKRQGRDESSLHDFEENGRTHMKASSSSSPAWRSRQQERRRARRKGRTKLRPIEFVSLQLTRSSAGDGKRTGDGSGGTSNTKELSRGKGVAEAASIVVAIDKSEIVRKLKPTHAVKVTGRYFVRNLDAELHRLAREAAAEPTSAESSPSSPERDISQPGDKSTIGTEPTDSANSTIMQAAASLWSQKSAKPWPLLTLQSTPSPWNLWDGVVRSEVVGFALSHENNGSVNSCYDMHEESDGNDRTKNYFSTTCRHGTKSIDDNSRKSYVAQGPAKWAEALFANQNEAVGRPMERVLFENARSLSAAASSTDTSNMAFQVGSKSPHGAVRWFNALEIDSTRNAEDDVIEML